MINGGIRFGVVERAQPFVCRNKKDENQSGEQRKAEREDGKWIGAASEQSIEQERGKQGRLRRRRRPQRPRERKVNGEFNLVWQPPFPLGRKKRNERERGIRERGFIRNLATLSVGSSRVSERANRALFRDP